MKIQDKVSGGIFQGADGAAHVTASNMQAAAWHGHNLIDAYRQLFTTGPWLSPPVTNLIGGAQSAGALNAYHATRHRMQQRGFRYGAAKIGYPSIR